MQSVVIKGNLTRDPELRTIPSGADVVNFTIAESRRFKKKDGTKGEETTFINCEAWEVTARLIEQLMSKGDPILVDGVLKTDEWEKDGVKHSRLKLRVNNFDKLYRKSNGDSTTAEATSTPASEPAEAVVASSAVESAVVIPGGDIPF